MNQPFTAASHHDILMLLIQIAVLLFTARILGELVSRQGQPSVIGEILAGIILGPSLLSGLFPVLGVWLIPHTPVQGYLLELVSLLGAMFMLIITGLEIDVGLIRRHARTAISTSVGGLLLPFTSGFLVAQWLPADLLTNPEQRLVFSLFFAITLSVAAIPVIAKVLMELDMLRRDIGQIIIASAMIDDITAWTVLSIVVGMAAGSTITLASVAQSIFSVAAFLIFSFTFGRWLVRQLLDFVQSEIKSRDAILSTVMLMAFMWGAISHSLHLEAVIGAFVMGILFGQMPGLPEDVVHKLESVALGIFAPIFFAVAGLKVDLASLLDPRLAGFALLVLTIACVGKVLGAYSGARLLGGRDHWTALTFGSALNARGAVEIIIATIGLSLGILSQSMFSIIVLVAITTSLIAPLALRWTFKHVRLEDEELERLRREDLIKHNLVANVHRVLLPVRLREDDSGEAVQTIEAHILERIGAHSRLSITLLNVVGATEKAKGTAFLNSLARHFARHTLAKKVLAGVSPSETILDEARKGYDLMILGAPEKGSASDVLFTPLVDYLIRLAPCPTMVIRAGQVADDWAPRRILVPTNGSVASRRAAEVGFALVAGDVSSEVRVLKVVVRGDTGFAADTREAFVHRQTSVAHQIVNDLRMLGELFDVPTIDEVRIGPNIESTILDVARSTQTDLIILGVNVRSSSNRLYLGSRVEYLLSHAPCPVLVVNALSGDQTNAALPQMTDSEVELHQEESGQPEEATPVLDKA